MNTNYTVYPHKYNINQKINTQDLNINTPNVLQSKDRYETINISNDGIDPIPIFQSNSYSGADPIPYKTSGNISPKNDTNDLSEENKTSNGIYNNYFSTFLETEIKLCNNDAEKNLLKQLCESFNPLEDLIKRNLPNPKQLIRIREHNKYQDELYKLKLVNKTETKERSKKIIKNLIERKLKNNSSEGKDEL